MIHNPAINSSDIFILIYYTLSACCIPGAKLGSEYSRDREGAKPTVPIPAVKTLQTAAEVEWKNSL